MILRIDGDVKGSSGASGLENKADLTALAQFERRGRTPARRGR